ncbi:chemotaxis protein CheA [Halorubrum sp. JWXQ-INN 858]|uniref:chemotaxis protein CheA n=1 Tax=Halorubrum sp. JWXQ-INN 858 TaxID=2690782 RepID=UPI00135A11DE|nr:chemotaxis protein CheA [Halorubrum sp. JWXQ-INN 858]MWV63629.1 chemotaxis protein CheA [Halorubrum sp. JWXQ-INN 858]
MESHRAAFVAEAEDGVTDLNNALLALEADPADDAAMDDVFRVAHTLKGNAAAMGYEDVSAFGHALEDLLDAVRRGDREVTPELMDLLFEGVDAVEAMIAEIADDGTVVTDPTDLEERLRAMEEDGSPDDAAAGDDENDAPIQDAESDTDDTRTGDGSGGSSVEVPDPPGAVADLDADGLVYADVTVGEAAMPGVDATFVLQALDSRFDGHVTDPDRETLEAGTYGDGFDVFVVAEDPAVVAEEVGTLTQVDAVETTHLDPAADDGGANGSVDSDRSDDDSGSDGNSRGADVDNGSDGSDANADDDGRASNGGSDDTIKSIRVGVDQVDELYGQVEQLVTSRIKLRRELEDAGVKSDALDELDKLASSLQDTAMDMRLIPFSQVSDSLPRLVRDVARDVDKRVTFDIEGDDVELDRTILTEMRDPLVHVLRNAVDHGIEPPAEREAAGKDPTGRVRLTAERDRDHVVIEVSDDGGGLDPDVLREKAVAEGVESREAVAAMDDSEAYDLVFHPGLSTAEEVTDVSGRGVGMDVVRTTARELDGSVSVDSEPGEGTTVRFRLPVTVAIVKVMFVDVGGVEYGIPIKSIAEIARDDGVAEVHGDEVVRHEGDLYPVIRLGERLDTVGGGSATAAGDRTTRTGGPAADTAGDDDTDDTDDTDDAVEPIATADGGATASDPGMLVRIREETRRVALHCDAVLDQEEVVVKPLDGPLSGTPGLSGTAVLGDGDVVAVLDVVSL